MLISFLIIELIETLQNSFLAKIETGGIGPTFLCMINLIF